MSNLFTYETGWLYGKNGSTGPYKFTCTVDLKSQSVANNTSKIAVKITLKGNSNDGRHLWTANAAINQPHGVLSGDVEKTGNGIVGYDRSTTPITVVSKTVNVLHNANGTKTLSITFGWVAGALVYYPDTQTFTTASITLPTIPRASSIVAENALISDDSGTLDYTITSAAAFYHKLILSFNGHTQELLSGQQITSTYNGSIEYSDLLEWLGDTVSASLKLTLYTYNDSAMTDLVGSKSATYTVLKTSMPEADGSVSGMFPKLFPANATEFITNGITTLTDVLSCVVTEERNGSFELEMVVAASTPYFEEIEIGRLIVVKPNHIQPLQAFEIYEIGRPINKRVTIKACHISYRANYIPVLPFEATGMVDTIIGLNVNAVEVNPFIISTDIDNETSVYKQKEPQSLRARLGGSRGSLLDTFGGEYLWDNFNIVLMTSRGADNNVQLRVGKNITDLRQTLNFDGVITGVLPYWVNFEDESVIYGEAQYSESADNYAYARTASVDFSTDFESEPSVAALNQKALDYVEQSKLALPSNNIKVKFIDLADTEEYKDSPLERVNLCDIVTVVYESLGISYKAKVVKLKYDPIAGRTIEAEIGDARSSLSETIQGVVSVPESQSGGGSGDSVHFLDSWPQARPITANIAPTSDARMFHFLSSSTMTEGKPDSDGHIVNFQWDNSNVVGTELYLHNRANNHNALGIRGGQAGGTWNDWAYADVRRELWTGTTQGGGNISLDCSAYSYIKVWVHAYNTIFPVYVDLTKAPGRTRAEATGNTAFRGSAASPVINTSNNVKTYLAVVEMNAAKSTVYIRNIGYYSGTTWTNGNSNAEYYAFKIEGYL